MSLVGRRRKTTSSVAVYLLAAYPDIRIRATAYPHNYITCPTDNPTRERWTLGQGGSRDGGRRRGGGKDGRERR